MRNPVEHVAASATEPIRQAGLELVAKVRMNLDEVRERFLATDVPRVLASTQSHLESLLADDGAVAQRLEQVGRSAWVATVTMLLAQFAVGTVAVLLSRVGKDAGFWASFRLAYGVFATLAVVLTGGRVARRLSASLSWVRLKLGQPADARVRAFALDSALQLALPVLVGVFVSVGRFMLFGSVAS